MYVLELGDGLGGFSPLFFRGWLFQLFSNVNVIHVHVSMVEKTVVDTLLFHQPFA